ncbi:MAG: ribosome assembly factor SBDS [Candidatus Diapherotrites archaeon]|nr:ribosome assembly factor SBDS [Candidatus Diapherotrites archaeon]
MVSVDKAVLARIEKFGHHFEILIDAKKALEYKKGIETNLDNVLAGNEVFSDSKKGQHATDEALMKAFNTTVFEEIAKIIIQKGEIQLTTELKRQFVEQNKKKIINLIASKAVDPQTHAPIPPIRIETAMDNAGVHISSMKNPNEQVEEVIKKIRLILPIKFETTQLSITIPALFTGKAYSFVHSLKPSKENWQSNGDLNVVVSIPTASQPELYSKLNSLTNGNVTVEVLERT